MRGAFLILLLAACGLSRARAESALEALGHLPKDQAAHLAQIEGRDGAPEPQRWYILVYDSTSENGVHEFVVANGQVVASRAISQFADSLKPSDVIDPGSIKADSTQVGKLAGDYAGANTVTASGINYELKKTGPDGVPAWKVSCLNDAGASLGEITVAAGSGGVISHDGFARTPEEIAQAATPKPEPARKTPKFDVYAKPEVAPGAVPTPSPEEVADAHSRHHHVPPKKGSTVGQAFKSFGHKVQNFFSF